LLFTAAMFHVATYTLDASVSCLNIGMEAINERVDILS
jgi:hypothetical protein